ncbi:hypothetical protein LJC72_04760 [Bacteroides sp. OttesenSCG-928-D19]|nr:hypothetical protein [Bacteroides sp. OttesenSCG-928-D19]
MRLTTKIIIGIILSVFTISLMFIIGFSFTGRKHYQRTSNVNKIDLPQDNKTNITITPSRVFVFECDKYNTEDDYSFAFITHECGLHVTRATTEEEENKLIIPEALSDFISTNTQRDTLFIRIKTNELVKKYKEDKKHTFFTGVNLHLHTTNTRIINKIEGLTTEIRSIETDSITIVSHENIQINSCKADFVEATVNYRYKLLVISDCHIQKLHLDLDKKIDRNIAGNNNNIIETSISGSNNHEFRYDPNNFGKITWQPKNKDASLNLIIKGDTTQISFQ